MGLDIKHLFTRRNGKILLGFIFMAGPLWLHNTVSKLSHWMLWEWGSPLVPGSDWLRWGHIYFICGTFFCILLYVPIISWIVRNQFRRLFLLFIPVIIFLAGSVVFVKFSEQQFAAQEGDRIEKALKRGVKDVSLYVTKAALLQRSGRYDRALDYFNKALAMDPNDAFLIHDIGFTYLTKGDQCRRDGDLEKSREAYSLAVPYFTRTLGMASKPGSFIAQTYNDRGAAYFFLGEYEKSSQDLRKAVQRGYHVHPEILERLRKRGYTV